MKTFGDLIEWPTTCFLQHFSVKLSNRTGMMIKQYVAIKPTEPHSTTVHPAVKHLRCKVNHPGGLTIQFNQVHGCHDHGKDF